MQKVRTWAHLVHEITSLHDVLKLKQNFQKNELVTGKTLFFVIGQFCCYHSVCPNIGFCNGSFIWK